MKHYKKILCLLLVLTLALSTVGCQFLPQLPTEPPTPTEPGNLIPESTSLTAEDFGCSNTYPEVDMSDYTDYYFDAVAGDDANDGKSAETAKKTLKAAEEIAATATGENPVRILLKKGTTFQGNWHLAGFDSTEEKPLIIDAYGDAGYPVIVGHGSDVYTDEDCASILIRDDNIRIFNLEITGKTAYQGIYVYPKETGAFKNVVIENCYVHDINFNWTYDTLPRDTSPDDIDVESVCPVLRLPQGDNFGRYVYRKYSAICLYPDTMVGPSWFENAWILSNTVRNVGKIGINVYNMWDNQPGYGYGYNMYLGEEIENIPGTKLGRFPNKYIVCNYNYIECPGADGIVLNSENSVMDGNSCYYANYLGRAGYWNAGIWVFGSRKVLFQNNEAAYTYMRNGGQDAQGFDIDNASSEIHFRNNYAHHNEGGGLLLCNKKTSVTIYDTDGNKKETVTEWGRWQDNYIYNNVFAYNGNPWRNSRAAFITIARTVKDAYIYNNLVICDPAIELQSIINTEDQGATCNDLYFYNNIFYSESDSGAWFTANMMYDYDFDNNLFWNVSSTGLETNNNPITDVDPMIEIDGNFNGFASLEGLRPGNSALYTMGKQFDGMCLIKRDILDTKVGEGLYIGALAEASK